MRSTESSFVRGGRARNVGYTRNAGWPLKRLPVVDMIETSERTRSGWRAARLWAIIPPIDAPTTWARSIPSAVSSPAASSAMSSSV